MKNPTLKNKLGQENAVRVFIATGRAFYFGKNMRICRVDGCKGKYRAKGYCVRHYYQFRNRGKTSKRLLSDKNEIIIKGDIAEIVLYDKNCKEKNRTIIDIEDIPKIEKFKWCVSSAGYVETKTRGISLRLAHVVLGIVPNIKRVPDHKDRNKLNNRKDNLRIGTQAQNTMNRPKQVNNTSGFKGVSKNDRGWMARINVSGKCLYLGIFKNKIGAMQAYDKAGEKHYGEFAYLNKHRNF